jgi:hypothetical protein
MTTKIDTATGLYIVFDEKLIDLIRSIKHSEADSKVEVRVQYLDQQKEFTLTEFLTKLGFAVDHQTQEDK